MKPALAGAVSALALAAALPAMAEMNFNRIASFPVAANLPEDADPLTETSAEIIDVTGDGMTLVYSDSPLGAIGLVDISEPAAPKPLGAVYVGGEPTSVSVRDRTAFVGINTSESYTEPSGRLAAIDLDSATETASCDLGGQPDSVKVAPDGSFVAVAIENERDEDLGDGGLPQAPAGFVAIVPLADGAPDCDGLIHADVTGLSATAPDDPEPEFVDVNDAGEIAVTMQENNAIAILGANGVVLSSFDAGAVDLDGIDTLDDGAIDPTGSQPGRLREPDAVAWVGPDSIAVANEGDWRGGSRGFTVFGRDGTVIFESGADFERAVARLGHYPDGRSDAKGIEPEGLAFARFGDTDMLFVLSERASVVGVYRVGESGPELHQILPSGISPESAVAIPERGLLATANEVDLGEDGAARAHVMLYAWEDAPAAYPSIVAAEDGPAGWGALSGLAADPATPGRLFAVSDSFYAMQPRIFEIDATATPARVVGAIDVTREGRPAQKLDLEGIVADGEGGFWLASEGRSDRLVPHALYHVDAEGEILSEVPFPPELLASEIRFGAEGVTMADGKLWVAIQREWGDDPAGLVKLLAYDPAEETWAAVHYPLEAAESGWVGLSEITAHNGQLYIVERDNQIGGAAKIKKLYRVALEGLAPAPLGGELPVVGKTEVHDFLPDLAASNGYVVDKLEGFAIDTEGRAWAVTDNDGVDDSSGETHFFGIGPIDAIGG